MEDFKYRIIKKIKTLSDNSGYTKEVNIIKYRDNEPVVDIRKWNRNTGKMQKGITLNKKEFEELKKCINSIEF